MVKDEIDILKEVITSMDVNINALSVTVDGDNWRVTTCNVLHLNNCSKVVYDGVTYDVVSVDESFESFVISGSGDPVASFNNGVKTIYTPELNFMWGTYSEANFEIECKSKGANMTYPIVFMLEEPLRSRSFGYKEIQDKEISCRLFFLQASSKKWNKEDHRHNATKGMQLLALRMQEYINKKKVAYEYLEEIEVVRLPEFSIYTNNQGKRTKIIDTLVSGIGTSFTLTTKKVNGCCKDIK